jgi:tRNA(His) guanylyltransferase
LPTSGTLIDYLRWRKEDAHRTALNAHCYWALRRKGADVANATAALKGLSVAMKNELLFSVAGINFNYVANWLRHGNGLYHVAVRKSGRNKLTGEFTQAVRRRIHMDFELPTRNEYGDFLAALSAREWGGADHRC